MKKILIIEDDQLVGNIYRNKFSVEDFVVEVATDGEMGFTIINAFEPDVVILDLMLPKISGLDLLKKIRAQESTKTLPVIVFSNTYLSNMVQEAWKAGATKCLSKANCTPKQVIDVVRSLSNSPVGVAIPFNPDTSYIQPYSSAVSTAATATLTLPVKPAAIVPEGDTDIAFQNDLRVTFLGTLPATIAAARTQLQAAAGSHSDEDKIKSLEELYRRIHTLTGNAGIAGVLPIAQMSDALEALLRELYEKPKNITASTLRTVALAIDFLGRLYEGTSSQEPDSFQFNGKANILVVDDEAISRRAVTHALERAKLPSVSVDSPEAALKLLAENVYDVIFLDVDMPGMNGFELCSKLRGFARNKNTPVIFVTNLNDFESRANSTMCGGNDLIAKPFLFMELAVKALVYVLRGRITA